MKRALAWLLLILGALLVLDGIIDFAVGPELAEQEPGVEVGEVGPRWYGLVLAAVGVFVALIGHRLSKKRST